MHKLFIFYKNFEEVQTFINKVLGKIDTIRIIGLSNSLKEFYLSTQKIKPDMILFFDFDEIISLPLEYRNIPIIMISKKSTNFRKSENRITISKKENFAFMQKTLAEFTEAQNLEVLRKKSIEILIHLGFIFKHVGTQYLIDAILYSYTHRNTYCFENLEKEVYPYVAQKHNTKIKNVKWSITRAINSMYLNHTTKSIQIVYDYFCLDNFEKPTPKLVIGMIVNKLGE